MCAVADKEEISDNDKQYPTVAMIGWFVVSFWIGPDIRDWC